MSSGGNNSSNSSQGNKLHPSQYGAEGLPGESFKGSIFPTSSIHYDKIYGSGSKNDSNNGGGGNSGSTNSGSNNSSATNSGDKK
ncbi:hypothetical protein PspLS_02968 [Pyricularia sp. CBS 133598]|nr:hypothetical protein PspLS_02968 [Pyricularia sp. CBS 133598]